MKKIIIVLGLLIIFLSACSKDSPSSGVGSDNLMKKGDYLGGMYEGNYVWGGAMNLAWNELSENIIGEEIKLKTKSDKAAEMVESLNNAPFSKNDLDRENYYVKSGYGQKTVDLINKECRKKFPSKSFDDLDMSLSSTDIISYAYFLKEVEYLVEFSKKDVLFDGDKVKGFYAENKEQKENIEVLEYANDDNFIIALNLKDDTDQIILAKGYDMTDPSNVVSKVNDNMKKSELIAGDDIFMMPNLHLDHNRDYEELIDTFFLNEGFEVYFIAKMFENIKFDMDNKGARVENEAVILMQNTAAVSDLKPRKFILDKPFWVVMKRTNSENPYFILGVNNTKVMEK